MLAPPDVRYAQSQHTEDALIKPFAWFWLTGTHFWLTGAQFIGLPGVHKDPLPSRPGRFKMAPWAQMRTALA